MSDIHQQRAKKAWETMRKPDWKSSKEISATIRARDNYTCRYCDQNLRESFFHWRHISDDHIVAAKEGGQFTEENLATSCVNCNALKHGRSFRSVMEAREYVQKRLSELRKEFDDTRRQ